MPAKQNALAAACTFVMLLLLGLYILDLNNVFARSSASASSSSSPLSSMAQSQSQSQVVYRHPIVAYDRSQQVNQVRADYPLEHYQQANSVPTQQINHNQLEQQFNPLQPQQSSVPQEMQADLSDMQMMLPPLAPPKHQNPFGSVQPHLSQFDNQQQQQQQAMQPRNNLFGSQMMQPPPVPTQLMSPPIPPPPTPPPAQRQPESAQLQPQIQQQPNMLSSQLTPKSSQQQQQQQQQLLPTQQTNKKPLIPMQSTPMQQAASVGNSTSQQAPIMFYIEDAEHPTKDIMRAIENFAVDRPLEQLFPQTLVQLHLASAALDGRLSSPVPSFRQILLDSLQPSVSVLMRQSQSQQQQQQQELFPSSSYESLCRSTAYIAQPKRAKSLTGQWKAIVNLPGHKYRGVAISQMVRVEECSSQASECVVSMPLVSVPTASPASSFQQADNLIQQQQQQKQQQPQLSYLPRSRCLQRYGNQQLVAWSPQLGFHIDIFRFPSSCSCHMKR